MDWVPHVTVATIVGRAGKYLMVEEHSGGKTVINQPAGHLEAGESLQQAAVRETLEETGWHIALKGVVGVALYHSANNGVTYHRTTFFAEAISEASGHSLDEGIIRPLWMSLEELQADSARMRSQLVIKAIEQYQRGHRYPLELIYD